MRSSGSKRRSSAFGGSKTALSAPLGEFYPWEALTQQGTGAAGAPQPGVARSRVSRGEVAGATLLVHGWPCALHVAASTARSTLHTPELPRQCVSPQQNPNAALREPHGSPKTSTRCTGPSSLCVHAAPAAGALINAGFALVRARTLLLRDPNPHLGQSCANSLLLAPLQTHPCLVW